MRWACAVIYKERLWPFIGDQGKKVTGAEFEAASLSQLPWLYTCAVYLAQDSEMAEGLVQETYLQAHGRFSSYNADTNARVWLLCILRRIFNRRYRKRVGVQATIDWDPPQQNGGSIHNLSVSQCSQGEVEKAVKMLPEAHRLALILVDIEELSYRDGARVMECSISRFRSRVCGARRMLQAALRNKVRPMDSAVSQGITADIDPTAWEIIDGKLYLNLSPGVARIWEKDIPDYMVKANKNWPALKDKQ